MQAQTVAKLFIKGEFQRSYQRSILKKTNCLNSIHIVILLSILQVLTKYPYRLLVVHGTNQLFYKAAE